MAKIIIPRSELPNLSQENVNRFRFRIINKNRNLVSQWSTIGNIKRPEEQADYTLPSVVSVEAKSRHLFVTWESVDRLLEYEIYKKEYTRMFELSSGSFIYSPDILTLIETTTDNNSVVYGSYSGRIGINPPEPKGAQVFLRNYKYPRIENNAFSVLQAQRKSNTKRMFISDEASSDFSHGEIVWIDPSITPAPPSSFYSFADFKVFNYIEEYTVDKNSYSGLIAFERTDIGADITIFNTVGQLAKISPAPLHVSDYVDYLWYNYFGEFIWEFYQYQAVVSH